MFSSSNAHGGMTHGDDDRWAREQSPLVEGANLPYRKPHAMRHSYATWMLEGSADLRWVKDQLGHASIEETEGTYGHLERERHERRVDLDSVFGTVHTRPPASTIADADGARRSTTRYVARRFHGGG
jgi:integrase